MCGHKIHSNSEGEVPEGMAGPSTAASRSSSRVQPKGSASAQDARPQRIPPILFSLARVRGYASSRDSHPERSEAARPSAVEGSPFPLRK
jgi:hypothetical protein